MLMLMLLAPPLVLFFWAHVIGPSHSAWDWVAIILAGLVGLAGAALASWRRTWKWGVLAIYGLILIPALPFIGFLAVCSTGNCL